MSNNRADITQRPPRELGFQTEIDFTLPRGYVDQDGMLHRQGVMRLATAADEILPQRDPRVQQNAAYFAIVVLSRVIVRLGTLAMIDTKTIEGLYASDLDYLQGLYERLNSVDEDRTHAAMSAPPADDGARPVRRLAAVGEA